MLEPKEEIDWEAEQANYSVSAEVADTISKPEKVKPKRKSRQKQKKQPEIVPKTAEELQKELETLKQKLEEKEKNIISLQAARAYTITSGTDETVPIGELRAIAYLFPDFPHAPTTRQLGETIRPQYIAALRRLRMLADI